ncbi:MAG: HAD hydrolase family protein [Candidatus Latescibacteria bacterium]|nr:HAD hydrolase family protein [Candidatus Latescibacterota bacterium]
MNKGVALRTLIERIGGSTDRVLAVGDADNDLPMLRAAGIGVLLGNAKDEVKAAVAGDGVRIGPSFAEDGFAKMVREYALDGQECK